MNLKWQKLKLFTILMALCSFVWVGNAAADDAYTIALDSTSAVINQPVKVTIAGTDGTVALSAVKGAESTTAFNDVTFYTDSNASTQTEECQLSSGSGVVYAVFSKTVAATDEVKIKVAKDGDATKTGTSDAITIAAHGILDKYEVIGGDDAAVDTVTAGAVLPIKITAQDAYGNTCSSDISIVTLASTPATPKALFYATEAEATAGAENTNITEATLVAGTKTVYAVFTKVLTSSGTYTVVAKQKVDSNAKEGTSVAITVSAADLDKYQISDLGDDVKAGVEKAFTVKAIDKFENAVKFKAIDLNLKSSDAKAKFYNPAGAKPKEAITKVTLSKDAEEIALTVVFETAKWEVKTVSGTKTAVGGQTITVTDANAVETTSKAIIVDDADPAKIILSADKDTVFTKPDGDKGAAELKVSFQDKFGNAVHTAAAHEIKFGLDVDANTVATVTSKLDLPESTDRLSLYEGTVKVNGGTNAIDEESLIFNVSANCTGLPFASKAFTLKNVTDALVIADKPEKIVVKAGEKSAEFTISGGNGEYEWTLADQFGNDATALLQGDKDKAKFTFKINKTGAFAGEYTVTAKDTTAKVDGKEKDQVQFKVYVPLEIEETRIIQLGKKEKLDVTLLGGKKDVTVDALMDSLDDDAEDVKVSPKFNDAGKAIASFDMSEYELTTAPKDFSVSFKFPVYDPIKEEALCTLIPAAKFIIGVQEKDETIIADAKVSVSKPVFAVAKAVVEYDSTDKVYATTCPAVDLKGAALSYEFKVEKEGYITKTFTSADFDEKGKIKITLEEQPAAVTTISGKVTKSNDSAASSCNVVLLDSKGAVLAGPQATDAAGAFSFGLAAKPEKPFTYSVLAYTMPAAEETKREKAIKEFTVKAEDKFPVTGADVKMAEETFEKIPEGSLVFDATDGAGDKIDNFYFELESLDNANLVVVEKPVAVTKEALKKMEAAGKEIEEAVKWEISGFSKGTAIIPVAFDAEDADKVADGSLIVWYNHEGEEGWEGWKEASVESVDYLNGLVYVKIEGWSANAVGLGNAPKKEEEKPVAGSGSSSSGCFISSASNGSLPLAGLMTLMVGAIALTLIRRRSNN